MKHLWKKILSMVLIAALLIQVLPATAKGAELTTDEYELQTGFSDIYEYLKYDAGKAGTIYVNTYNAKPHIRRTDISLGGERLPVDIEFYYDPINFEYGRSPYGYGWMSSYNQWIIYDEETCKYQYVNENGTKIYFSNSGDLTESGREIWTEDTLYGIGKYEITLFRLSDVDKTSYGSIFIKRDGLTYGFDQYGRLSAISDGTGAINIVYGTSSKYEIKYIEDMTGRRYNFSYVSGYLRDIEVVYQGSVVIGPKITYIINNGKLSKVGYYNEEYISYKYDYASQLTYVRNIDDCGYGITYENAFDVIKEIVQVAGIDTSSQENGKVTNIYHVVDGQTSVTDEESKQLYGYDKFGRILSYELRNLNEDGDYQTVYGYKNTYDYITNEDGSIINDLVDVEYYDANGVIEETDSEEDIATEEVENTEELELTEDTQASEGAEIENSTEETTEIEEDIVEDYVTTEDGYGNILTETHTVGELQQITQYQYEFNGDLLNSVTDINGSTQKYSYGYPINKPTGITDGNGNKTSYTYNALWELASVQMNVSGLKTLTEDMSLVDDATSIGIAYTYEKGRLTAINYGDCTYSFTYDKWGNLLSVSMDERALVTYDYGENAYKGLVHIITYGNGESVYYTYNTIGQVIGIGYTDEASCFEYTYSLDGELETIYDVAFQRVTQFTDNGYTIYSGTLTNCNKVLYEYEGTEENYSEYILGKILEYQVENDENISWLQVLDDVGVEIFSEKVTNDGFERLQEKLLTVGTLGITQKYGYITNGNVTGNRVSDYTIEYKAGSEEKNLQFFYTYDGNGNILSIEEKEQNVSTSNWNYVYDEAGQLIEACNTNSGICYKYAYDKYGNLVCKEEYSVAEDGTETLIEQELMSYDGMVLVKSYSTKTGETSYTTDAMGSITSISNAAGNQQFIWGEGRMLLEMSGNDYQAKYVYNDEGLRIIKELTQAGTTTYTEYEWGKNGLAGFTTGEDTVVLLYGQDGTPIGFTLNDTVYTYIKNLQGDVIRILDTDGNTVVEYTYDPWGVPTITGDIALAAINPCSYRCYDYDEESGYYYLQSRYYNPQTGRFLNVDDVSILEIGNAVQLNNLFTYCNNDPVNRIDSNGNFSIKVYAVAAVTAAVIAAISKIVGNYAKGLRGWNLFRGVLGTSVGNAVNIVLLMKLVRWGNEGIVLAAFVAASVQTVIDFAEGVLVDKKYSWNQLTEDYVTNFASTFLGNYLGAKCIYVNGYWIQTTKATSFFTKSYGKRLIAQTGIGSVISLLIDLVKNGLKNSVKR